MEELKTIHPKDSTHGGVFASVVAIGIVSVIGYFSFVSLFTNKKTNSSSTSTDVFDVDANTTTRARNIVNEKVLYEGGELTEAEINKILNHDAAIAEKLNVLQNKIIK